ncbi:hypothetical protein V5T82_09065 [Magnetovibrio sp. PR-2]|uniref:hypothetical protein n=1 Tax=Magnetovibrio sp. PR-2 TaxID=3120356 RepID=UPI002FCDEAB6
MDKIRDKVAGIVFEALEHSWAEYDHHEKASMDSAIFGKDSLLDSTALVSMVLDIEEHVEEVTGVTVSLLDEKAVSQEKSPFRNVSAMIEFVMSSIEEQ